MAEVKYPFLEKIDDKIQLENIITESMEKIDVHKQIEMNIDIIVDILYNEFKLDKKYEDSSNIRFTRQSPGFTTM